MKIIQMMGPIHLKGGEWAQETAPEVVRLQVRISGTALATPRKQEQLIVKSCIYGLQRWFSS